MLFLDFNKRIVFDSFSRLLSICHRVSRYQVVIELLQSYCQVTYRELRFTQETRKYVTTVTILQFSISLSTIQELVVPR